MSDEPLYYKQTIQKLVNPTRILPSLLQKQRQKNKQSKQKSKFNINLLLDTGSQKCKIIKKQDYKDYKNFRTKMCPYGRDCKRRFTCRFAHTQQQLRKPFIKRKNPCLLYQRGKCSLGSACRDYHGNIDLQKSYKYKQKICENFKLGTCQKGDICIFIHESPQQQLNIQSIQAQIQNQQNRCQSIDKIDQYVENEENIKQLQQCNKQMKKQQQKQKQEQIFNQLPQGFSITFD